MEPVVALPSGEKQNRETHAAQTVVSDQVEAALRKLLSEEVAKLTKEGKGGPKCWPAVLLEIAARQLRTPDGPEHPVAHLIAQVLDLHHAVPEAHRTEVIRFCRTIAEQTHSLGLGSLHHWRKTARPFVEEALKPLGEDRTSAHVGATVGRHLTLQQLISRLDAHQPFEVQALAVKVLPDIVNPELRNAPRLVKERQKTLQRLTQAVGMVGGTKYFESLAPKMREACESQMDGLKHRIERAGRQP
jgi:hypothetical protein